MKIDELIKKLTEILSKSDVDEIEIKTWFRTIRVSKKKESTPIPQIITPQIQQIPQMQAQPVKVEKKEEIKEEIKEEKPEVKEVKEEKEEEKELVAIRSPMVGTFYRAPAPGAKPYVEVGDIVKEDTIVCIIEAMKVFNEIPAGVKGKIVKILVENEQPVEYGQELFLVEPM